jgi:PAS domain S-box-containing protein
MPSKSIEEKWQEERGARERAEALLADEQNIYEQSAAMLCSLDVDSLKVLRCNQGLVDMVGRDKEKIIDRSFLELAKTSEHHRLQELFTRTKVGARDLVRGEFELLREGDGHFLAGVVASRVIDVHGCERIRVAIQDVTGPRVQVTLTKNQARMESLFKSSPDFLLLVALDETIEFINRVEASWRMEQIIGAPLKIFFAPEDHAPTTECIRLAVRDRSPQSWDVKHNRDDGTVRYFNAIASPVIIDDEVRQCVVALRDTTVQVQLAKEKSHLEEHIRQTQKLEAIGLLAGGIAHDFNNILTAIMGYTSLAQLQLAPGDPSREWADEISKAASRAAGLTRQLLAFSRRQMVTPKVIDMGQLVANLVPMLQRLISESIDLQWEVLPTLGGVLIDPNQAELILLNLAINARDAMDGHGVLTIGLHSEVLEEEVRKTHPKANPGPHVVLSVRDTGCGMTTDEKERIFEPFFTTKEVGLGTGLGLSTVYGIVDQANGWISVESEPTQGSCFCVYLPITSGKIEALASSGTKAPVGGHETILLVEDDDSIRGLALRLLRRLGYRVLSAAHAMEAIEISAANKGAIDMLVTDVVMPGLNGRELADRIQDEQPQMRILFTSGYPRDVVSSQGILEEGVEFLSKPYSFEALADHVRKIAKKSS